MNLRRVKITEDILMLDDKCAAYNVVLNYLCHDERVYIDVKSICAAIYDGRVSRENCDKITRTLSKYKSKLKYEKCGDQIYCFRKEHLDTGKYFAYLNWDDVKQVFYSNSKHKYALIKYMCAVALSFDKTNKICTFGYMPISYFQSVMGKSKSTIITYNEELEEMKIMYFCKRHRSTNVYSFIEGKEDIKVFID